APWTPLLPCPPCLLVHGSAVTVTQTPSFVSGSTGKNISFRCSVDEAGYRLYWYQQLPGETELKDLQNRLKAKWEDPNSRKMHLDLLGLQASDTGFYLCAAIYDASTLVGGGSIKWTSNGHPTGDKVVLLSPLCHKKSINLVCLAQGFHYEWPLDVIWERDGQKINRLSSATEPIKKQGECNFATASRMRVLAEEWQQGHNYSCHVNQTGQVVSDSVKSSPDHKTGKEMLGS
uniref:Ig-like domain-containing protein n=1 Tax=Pseudonaja textilis TaxID=8673 RepID=A0A670Z322_PSETE